MPITEPTPGRNEAQAVTGTRVGGIEAGGTKFICAVGTTSGELSEETRIPTRTPAETLAEVIAFFRPHETEIAALGIGSFGPIELRRGSPAYGRITATPKLAWRDFDIVGAIRRAFPVPIGFDTDVNAAMLAEAHWGAAQGLETAVYVTVGTGIGGGAIVDGSLLHGLRHPEMGHIHVPHDRDSDPFVGLCPYHGDCLEGLASGPAIEARWGAEPSTLPADHPAFQLEAEYLAFACLNWILTLSPQRIVLGGGVMEAHLFPLLRERTRSLLNGYIDAPELADQIDAYIVPPALGNRSGILGALALAADAGGASRFARLSPHRA
jgi:fructokinase